MALSVDELHRFMTEIFPRFNFTIVSAGNHSAVLELETGERHLRPGGTISGPTLMTMADVAMYIAVLADIGKVALAVTTNLNINFLRKPDPGTLRAEARILKLGKRLATGDVLIFNVGNPEAVAHASVTYSIPPRQD